MREGGGSPDFRRVRPWDWLSGGVGLALFFVLWMEWYERPQGGATAWEAFAVVDLFLVVAALLAIALPILTAAREAPTVPLAVLVFGTALSLLGVLLVLYRLVDAPGEDAGLSAGAWIGAVCITALLVLEALAMRDESSPGLEPGATVPVLPAPPREVSGTEPTAPPA